MTSKPVHLVLGAGANIGKALAAKFSSTGYGIALASRSTLEGTTPEGYLGIKVNLSDPSTVPSVFAKVKSALGTLNTIIYNAANVSPSPDTGNLFSLPLETFQGNLNIMNSTAFAAAKEAVDGFDTLPEHVRKTFIYTGNCLNTKILPVPSLVTLGVEKASAAYWVRLANLSFASKGYRFYYGDERKPEGGPVSSTNAQALAEVYEQLATGDLDVPWQVTFVPGKGYVDFSKL